MTERATIEVLVRAVEALFDDPARPGAAQELIGLVRTAREVHGIEKVSDHWEPHGDAPEKVEDLPSFWRNRAADVDEEQFWEDLWIGRRDAANECAQELEILIGRKGEGHVEEEHVAGGVPGHGSGTGQQER